MDTSRLLMAADEFSDVSGEEVETGGGLLGDLSSNFRIIIMVAAAVIVFFVMRELYAVLINREWHPTNAKLLTFSILFTLLCGIFTVLFVGQVMLFVIIAIWTVLIIFVVLALLKRTRRG